MRIGPQLVAPNIQAYAERAKHLQAAGVLTTLDFNFGPGGPSGPDRLSSMIKELKAL